MFSARNCIPALFTLGVHSLLALAAILLPSQGTSTPGDVYYVSLSQVCAPAEGPSAPAAPMPASIGSIAPELAPVAPEAPAESAPLPPEPVAEPVPPMPEEPIVSPKKQPQAEAKKPAPKKPPRRPQPRPQQAPADQAQARATPEAGAGGGDQGLRQVGGFAAYSSDAVDQVPVISRRVLPDYPLKARRRDLQGRVVVRLVVDATGMPRACVVQEANPRGYFEDAALEAARQTRFIPGKRQGRIVNTVVLLPFNFSLR